MLKTLPNARTCGARRRPQLFQSFWMQQPEHSLRGRIGFLALDAPVLQLLERNRNAGDGAANKRPWPQHPEIAVEIFDLGFRGRAGLEPIEHVLSPWGRAVTPRLQR